MRLGMASRLRPHNWLTTLVLRISSCTICLISARRARHRDGFRGWVPSPQIDWFCGPQRQHSTSAGCARAAPGHQVLPLWLAEVDAWGEEMSVAPDPLTSEAVGFDPVEPARRLDGESQCATQRCSVRDAGWKSVLVRVSQRRDPSGQVGQSVRCPHQRCRDEHPNDDKALEGERREHALSRPARTAAAA